MMAPHGADPAFFGTRSGDNDMKSATTVHFIGGRGVDVVVSAEAQC